MKYVSALIRVLDAEGGPAVVDVTKVDSFKCSAPNRVRVYLSGCEAPLLIQSNVDKFGEQVNNRRKEIWEAQHAVDILKIQLLAEIRDNTKTQEYSAEEIVAQMKHAMYGDGSVVLPMVTGEVKTDSPKGF